MTRSSHSYRHWIATGLAHAFLADAAQAGGRTATALQARAVQCLGGDAAWLRPLAATVATEFSRRWEWHTVPTLAAWLYELPQLDDAFDPEHERPRIRRLLLRPAHMVRAPFALEGLRLPRWDTPADLAAWLGAPLERLAWLMGRAHDFRETQADRPLSAHYHPLLKPKRSGGLRLIEIPKPELKQVQRRLLSGLLDAIPSHEGVHGFVRGRSAISNAREHAGRAVVIAYDLRDFFNSIGIARIRALWRTLGYAEGVAEALARLTTARTPLAVRERLLDAGSIDWMGAKRLASRHLPQGCAHVPRVGQSVRVRAGPAAGGLGLALRRALQPLRRRHRLFRAARAGRAQPHPASLGRSHRAGRGLRAASLQDAADAGPPASNGHWHRRERAAQPCAGRVRPAARATACLRRQRLQRRNLDAVARPGRLGLPTRRSITRAKAATDAGGSADTSLIPSDSARMSCSPWASPRKKRSRPHGNAGACFPPALHRQATGSRPIRNCLHW